MTRTSRGRSSGCPRIRRPNLTRPTTFGQSQGGREPVGRQAKVSFLRFPCCLSAASPDHADGPPSSRVRTPERLAGRSPIRPAPARRTVREARFTSRTGPPPAGNEAAVSPSPLRPTRRADPRSTHGSAPPRTRPERTAGRTATHQEHARTPRTGPARGRPGPCAQGRPACASAAVPRWSAGMERLRPTPCHPHPHPPARPAPQPPGAGSAHRSPHPPTPPSIPPQFLRASSASPSPPFTPAAPQAPPDLTLPTVPGKWPGRTTIPPYGRPALNGRDAANYAGFTDVLGGAAYSSGLGQMRVRPECRGPSLGRTRYECRAPQR